MSLFADIQLWHTQAANDSNGMATVRYHNNITTKYKAQNTKKKKKRENRTPNGKKTQEMNTEENYKEKY